MSLKDTPIRRKLMLVILATSVVVMLLMRGAFFTYEYLAFRQAARQHLATTGQILAANSTAALTFDNPDDAREILAALKAESQVVAAALYDRDGVVFAHYPNALPASALPAPHGSGYSFAGTRLTGFQPVILNERRIGTLYLEYDLGDTLHAWLWDSLRIALAVMAIILAIAYLLSRALQRQVSQPILALAGTARAISERRDYSVRAAKLGNDELGQLTDSFNLMLDEIQALNRDLEKRVAERTAELELSRAEWRSLFESIDEGYCIIEVQFAGDQPVDFRFLITNPAFTKQSGLAGAEGRSMREIDPTYEEFWFQTYGRVALTGEPIRFQNYAARLARWFDIYAFRVGLPEKRQVAILFTNITERKEREEQIRQLNLALQQRATQLEGANRELEAFSYSVSHDLRAPLRHVDGFANLLQKQSGAVIDEQGQRYLATISAAARQMGRLIDDLLSFSRMGRSHMQLGEIDQGALVADVIHEGHFQAGDRVIDWQIAPLPRIQADRAMLHQVWANLIGNAVKYSGKVAKPRIEIGTLASPDADERVFFVRDNGAGFDMRYRDKLFGVFQRLHGATEFEGTGIGLANVRRIITRHGGRTWAEGEPGKGATFFFSLPIKPIPPT